MTLQAFAAIAAFGLALTGIYAMCVQHSKEKLYGPTIAIAIACAALIWLGGDLLTVADHFQYLELAPIGLLAFAVFVGYIGIEDDVPYAVHISIAAVLLQPLLFCAGKHDQYHTLVRELGAIGQANFADEQSFWHTGMLVTVAFAIIGLTILIGLCIRDGIVLYYRLQNRPKTTMPKNLSIVHVPDNDTQQADSEAEVSNQDTRISPREETSVTTTEKPTGPTKSMHGTQGAVGGSA